MNFFDESDSGWDARNQGGFHEGVFVRNEAILQDFFVRNSATNRREWLIDQSKTYLFELLSD